MTGELSRAVSRSVRPEPQQLWSSNAPHNNIQCINLSSSLAFLTVSVKL